MSKKKYNHQFSNHAFGQTGTMICSCCGEKITSGDYLYAKQNLPHDDWQYVSWHRKCSTFADWNSEDKKRMNQINSLESELQTLLNSKNKLKNYDSIVSEIEWEIQIMEKNIERLKHIYFPEPIPETDEEPD